MWKDWATTSAKDPRGKKKKEKLRPNAPIEQLVIVIVKNPNSKCIENNKKLRMMNTVATKTRSSLRLFLPSLISHNNRLLRVNGGVQRRLFSAGNDDVIIDDDDDIVGEKPELEMQGVDPRKGWGFRGVHKAIICGKIGQPPLQKILRNGRTVTIFTVGTGGMFDQRTIGAKDLPKPAQWHRIAVHNETLGAYAVQQFVKNSSVYVEGDIETRVYNDSINGEVKHIPEICIRRDGMIRLFKTGESINSISFDELRDGLI